MVTFITVGTLSLALLYGASQSILFLRESDAIGG